MPKAPSSTFEPARVLPLVIEATPDQLRRFGQLMAGEGWTVNLQRMGLDRLYARERLARAHTSADDELRALAVRLFEACGPQVAVSTATR
jgi:hypothetical protein